MVRYFFHIAYKGTNYRGWQRQSKVVTIQEVFEENFAQVFKYRIPCLGCGRTDAGVHALQQVVHFDVPSSALSRPRSAWIQGANTLLPAAVKVLWAQPVPSYFHARFSAIARQYVYIIYNHPISSPFFQNTVMWVKYPLCADSMHTAAQYLVGERDFSAFRARHCRSFSARLQLRSAIHAWQTLQTSRELRAVSHRHQS